MRRHPHLRPLSDDHHGALVLARRIALAARQHPERGPLSQAWDDLQRRYHERNAAVFNKPTPPVIMPPKAMTAGGGK